jgi:hypothetical protein
MTDTLSRDDCIAWTPELESARIDLCEFLIRCADDPYTNYVHVDLSKRLLEAEQELTILGDIALASRAGDDDWSAMLIRWLQARGHDFPEGLDVDTAESLLNDHETALAGETPEGWPDEASVERACEAMHGYDWKNFSDSQKAISRAGVTRALKAAAPQWDAAPALPVLGPGGVPWLHPLPDPPVLADSSNTEFAKPTGCNNPVGGGHSKGSTASTGQPPVAVDPTPSDALAELVADDDETKFGKVTWHSGGEDEGPDVGMALGLGADATLWLGDMPNSTLADHNINGDGWWFVLYDGKRTEIAARVVDGDAARALFDRLATALAAVVEKEMA